MQWKIFALELFEEVVRKTTYALKRTRRSVKREVNILVLIHHADGRHITRVDYHTEYYRTR